MSEPSSELLSAGEASPEPLASVPFTSPALVDRIVAGLDGEEWAVTVVGSTRSGWGQDSGAPLVRLRFTRTTGVGAAAGGITLPDASSREVLTVARSLEELSDPALFEILTRGGTPGPV